MVGDAQITYMAWNQALCEVIFTADHAGTPVYLDMDDDVLEAVALAVGVDAGDVVDRLTTTVRATLDLAHRGSVFETHLDGLAAWRARLRASRITHEEVGPPPIVGLLAVFTLAAEAMEADSDHRPHAYYPRLYRLLGVDDADARRRLESAYRRHAEALWRGLNEWLSATDGKYGLPTAYSLSHRYVGLPMSQALVRATDRRHFARMFTQFGLPPGTEVPPADMVPLLDQWIRQSPSPVSRSLQSLWQHGAAQERIATVASVELLHWEGGLDDQNDRVGDAPGEVRLLALLRRFPQPLLEISFVAQLRTSTPPHTLLVVSSDDQPELEVVPAAGARVRPASTAEIDARSLVEGLLDLKDPILGASARRHPRRVVPLRRDELLNAYVECERVHLGEDVMLLVRDDVGLRRDVVQTLARVARPGFREHTTLPGLPEGWVLVADVQVMTGLADAPARSDLDALVPLLSSQLTLAGGLKLPGRVPKWSSRRPPEIRAVMQQAEKVSVTLVPLDDDESAAEARPENWTEAGPSLIVDLSRHELQDGDYELSLASDRRIVQQTILRLRSSETPDLLGWETAPRLVHNLSTALSVITAQARDAEADVTVDGPWTSTLAEQPLASAVRADDRVWWGEPKPAVTSDRPPIMVAAPNPESCVVTGAHRMMLPTFYGRATSSLVVGTCATCGLVKRYPAWYSERRSVRRQSQRRVPTSAELDVHDLPEVSNRPVSWADAFDALVHVGGGSVTGLERVALQVDGSSLFVDTLTRTLETLGHIEVRRGPMLEPKEWNITPPYLAELVDGSLLLTGAWTPSRRDRLRELTATLGGTLRRSTQADGPERWVASDVDAAEVARTADEIGTAGVVPAAARQLLYVLPPLGNLEAALPTIAMPGARRITRFHPPSASWVPVATAAEPGAYRLMSAFATTDVFRTADDVDRGDARLGTVQLVKYLEARRTGRALVAYDPGSARLAVPLGADLPGLYGRALVLCSGRSPGPVPKQRCLVYHDVPRDVADLLTTLLMA